MSIIGSLETFSLSAILQRVEAHAKTGLLLVKQNERGIALYFRQGQLHCIGPVRSNITLGERLLQAEVISQWALQESLRTIGAAEPNETRMALTLIDLGYLSQERLYGWAANEATQVLHTLLSWRTGEVYFEDEVHPPVDRLSIAFSVGSLLPSHAATPQTATAEVTQIRASTQPILRTGIANTPTLFLESQFSLEPVTEMVSIPAMFAAEAPVVSIPLVTSNSGPFSLPPLIPPRGVAAPLPPRRIDTSFLLPQMILVSADLSGLRQQNPELQLTPEQWQLLARVDGRTSLQMICQMVAMTGEMMCQVAGELLALGLVTVTLPSTGLANEASSALNNQVNTGLTRTYVVPAYTVAPIEPRVASLPVAEQARSFSTTGPIETQSQWGNGGNGATFVLGGGWVLASQPTQSLPSSGRIRVVNPAYAHAGEAR